MFRLLMIYLDMIAISLIKIEETLLGHKKYYLRIK